MCNKVFTEFQFAIKCLQSFSVQSSVYRVSVCNKVFTEFQFAIKCLQSFSLQ